MLKEAVWAGDDDRDQRVFGLSYKKENWGTGIAWLLNGGSRSWKGKW